jgi:hypothetical protein
LSLQAMMERNSKINLKREEGGRKIKRNEE